MLNMGQNTYNKWAAHVFQAIAMNLIVREWSSLHSLIHSFTLFFLERTPENTLMIAWFTMRFRRDQSEYLSNTNNNLYKLT